MLGQKLSSVKLYTVPITRSGAAILKANHEIPQLARIALDKYANTRVKELKLVTKAFRYTFPFYDGQNRKRAFNKVFSITEKKFT
jgi:hypothetical protein